MPEEDERKSQRRTTRVLSPEIIKQVCASPLSFARRTPMAPHKMMM
jgi:hypothetical protein